MRGDLNHRLVQWLRLWRANSCGGKPDCDADAGRRLPVALHAMNCVCSERFVRHCIAPLPHPTPARRCAPCKRWYQTPTSLRHGGPRPWGRTVARGSGKRLCPASDSTTRKRPGVEHDNDTHVIKAASGGTASPLDALMGAAALT